MEDYRFERLNEKTLIHLVSLYKSCFNTKVSLSFLQKKYATGLFGAEFIGFLAFSEQTNEAAAYYGVFPIQCRKNNNNILAAQSGDTMTHPSHQGKGLFIRLAKLTFQLAKEAGVEFVFGFPNKNSYPGFAKKLNWSFYGEVNTYIVKTGSLPFDKLAKKLPAFGRLYNYFIKQRLNHFESSDAPENSLFMQDSSRGAVCHDALFYRYKGYYPFYVLRLKNFTCVVKIDGRMWVGDVSFSEGNFEQKVDKLLVIAKKIGCSSVHFSLFKGSVYDDFFAKRQSPQSSLPVGYLNFHGRDTGNGFMYQGLDFDTF